MRDLFLHLLDLQEIYMNNYFCMSSREFSLHMFCNSCIQFLKYMHNRLHISFHLKIADEYRIQLECILNDQINIISDHQGTYCIQELCIQQHNHHSHSKYHQIGNRRHMSFYLKIFSDFCNQLYLQCLAGSMCDHPTIRYIL